MTIEAQTEGALMNPSSISNIEIRHVRRLMGPNVWSNRSVLEAWVALGHYEELPSHRIPGFTERLMHWVPSLIEHRCSEGVRGGFLTRLQDGTWLGHVLEHVTLELQTLTHQAVGFGRARGTGEPGVYRVIVECIQPDFAEHCLRSGLALIQAAANNTAFDIESCLTDLRLMAEKYCLGPSTQAIVSSAAERGIPAIRLWTGNLMQLGYGRSSRRIWTAETDQTGAVAESIAQDKQLTRQMLSALGIPVAEGCRVESPEQAWRAAQQWTGSVVVKPLDGNHGRGVSIAVEGQSAVEAAFHLAMTEGSGVVVERYVAGRQFRVLVVGENVVAASAGESEQVVGDGIATIAELVEAANLDPRRGENSQQPLTALEFDPIALALLSSQGFGPQSVLELGQVATLHHNGDFVVDVTSSVHPDVASSCVLAAQAIGLDIAGIDLIASDISAPLSQTGGAILEVNASPSLVMHINPLVGGPQPVGKAITDHLFGQGERKTLPIVALSGSSDGSNQTRATATAIASALLRHGHYVAVVDASGTQLGDERVSNQDSRSLEGATCVLTHPLVDAAIFEISADQVLREGLPFAYCDVAVVFGTQDEGYLLPASEGAPPYVTPDLVRRAVRVPADVVLPGGWLVLNADAPGIASMAERCAGRVLYVSRTPHNPLVIDHVARGEKALTIIDNAVIQLTQFGAQELFSLSGIDAREVDAALAYAGTLICLGVTPTTQDCKCCNPVPESAPHRFVN